MTTKFAKTEIYPENVTIRVHLSTEKSVGLVLENIEVIFLSDAWYNRYSKRHRVMKGLGGYPPAVRHACSSVIGTGTRRVWEVIPPPSNVRALLMIR